VTSRETSVNQVDELFSDVTFNILAKRQVEPNYISSVEDVFNEAAPVYQEALRKSGYTHKLEYKPKTPTPKRNRHRNVILARMLKVTSTKSSST